MRYRNPPIRSRSMAVNEDREVLGLILVVGATLLVLLLGTAALATSLAPYIPFSFERSLAGSLQDRLGLDSDSEDPEKDAALQQLADRLVEEMGLPKGMGIQVHYVDAALVNAGATLGGHLLIYRGLIEELKSEQALAAVLAHEIGHVRERHVIQALGRGMAVLLALRTIGVKSQWTADWLLGDSAQLTLLGFSREAEREADRAALQALYRVYGDIGGALELFDLFAEKHGGTNLDLWRTHPGPDQRRLELTEQAERLGYPLTGERRPLPKGLNADDNKP